MYAPGVVDSQNDFASAAVIEKAAHEFLSQGRVGSIDVDHSGRRSGSRVVESFIAQGSDTFPDGAWVIGVKTTPSLWQEITAGRLNGFSLTGRGTRTEQEMKDGKTANELTDLTVTGVSIVRRGANRQPFALLKEDADMSNELNDQLRQVLSNIEALAGQLDEQSASLSPQRDVARENMIKTQMRAHHLAKRILNLNERLESLWNGSTGAYLPSEAEQRQRELVRQIEDAEVELRTLSKADPDDGLDGIHHSAFTQRGGRSMRLSLRGTIPSEGLGVRQKDDELRKAEQSISLSSLII